MTMPRRFKVTFTNNVGCIVGVVIQSRERGLDSAIRSVRDDICQGWDVQDTDILEVKEVR